MPTNSGPKITLWLNNLEEATLRRVKQLGVDHVCMGGPKIPWTTEKLGGVDRDVRRGGAGVAPADDRWFRRCHLRS